MIILNVKDLTFSFGVNKILEDVSFIVDSADRCGVVGVNGAGKSTLFDLLNGEHKPDGGSIQYARGTTVGYFRQNNDYSGDSTIGDAVHKVFADVLKMESELAALEHRISSVTGGSGGVASGEGGAQALIKRYDRLRLEFELADGYEYRSRVRGVLNGLDIGDGIDDGTPVSILSGGQKTRLALALMLIKPPDLLLLDEPTNHLDIRSLEWLEGYLKNYKKSLLIVSHDRYFLDAVTTRTLDIEYRRLTAYVGGYTAFVKKKQENREIQERHYENQQREIARLEAVIEQYKRWNTERSHITARSREKALNRIERVDRPSGAMKKVNLRFEGKVSNSQDALYIDGISKSYSGRKLFEPFSATVRRGDRIMILGPNGCGKSTLLRLLSGQIGSDSGDIEAGNRIEMSFYDQEHFDLDDQKTVFDEIYDEYADLKVSQIRTVLGTFLFTGDNVFKRIGVLSGGEKARVALVKLVLSHANMLLLDEPTNHLDINTREKLEDALLEFTGVILAVSHDRYFIRKLAARIFYFEDNQILDFPGGYDDFLEYQSRRGKGVPGSAKPAATPDAAQTADKTGHQTAGKPGLQTADKAGTQAVKTGQGAAGKRGPDSAVKSSWLAARESRSRQRKNETRLTRLEERITGVEKRLAELDALMHSNDVVSDHIRLIEYMAEQDEQKNLLDGLIAEWEELQAAMETIE